MATSLFDTLIIDTPEARKALEEAFREAEARGPWKSRIDLSEFFIKGSMLIELDENWDLITPAAEAEKKT